MLMRRGPSNGPEQRRTWPVRSRVLRPDRSRLVRRHSIVRAVCGAARVGDEARPCGRAEQLPSDRPSAWTRAAASRRAEPQRWSPHARGLPAAQSSPRPAATSRNLGRERHRQEGLDGGPLGSPPTHRGGLAPFPAFALAPVRGHFSQVPSHHTSTKPTPPGCRRKASGMPR